MLQAAWHKVFTQLTRIARAISSFTCKQLCGLKHFSTTQETAFASNHLSLPCKAVRRCRKELVRVPFVALNKCAASSRTWQHIESGTRRNRVLFEFQIDQYRKHNCPASLTKQNWIRMASSFHQLPSPCGEPQAQPWASYTQSKLACSLLGFFWGVGLPFTRFVVSSSPKFGPLPPPKKNQACTKAAALHRQPGCGNLKSTCVGCGAEGEEPTYI